MFDLLRKALLSFGFSIYSRTLKTQHPKFHVFVAIVVTRKDMTHSVISIDSINFNSMSTDSPAVRVLDC